MTYTEPPGMPSPEYIAATIGILCLAAGAVLLFGFCSCAPRAQYPAYCTDEAAFTARQLACVDEAARETKDEDSFRAYSRKCRAAVHERCGIVYTGAKDAGAP